MLCNGYSCDIGIALPFGLIDPPRFCETITLSKALPINFYFVLFEGMIYVLFGAAVWRAARQGRFALIELGWMCLYGLTLEWLTIRVLHVYQYSQFLIMVDNIPLCIGLGWAIIIDSSMRFTDSFQFAESIRPIATALVGLSVDLALDVIAIRVGLWHWTAVKFDQQWFGVPWANFGAWFMVIWTYAGFIRAFRSWRGRPLRQWLYPALAIGLSLLILIAAAALYPAMSATIVSGSTPALLIAGSLGFVLWSKPQLVPGHPQDTIVILIQTAFHVFALFVGISSGIFIQQPILALIELSIFAISLGLHGVVIWGGRAVAVVDSSFAAGNSSTP
jgi:hypothetical protein